MIFLDSNIPMYLVGAQHPNKTRAIELLQDLLAAGEELVTDAEVFQEILHRYFSIHRLEAIAPAFEVLTQLTDEVYPIEVSDVMTARDLLLSAGPLTARDAIHVAVMRRRGVSRILSFDTDFDHLSGIRRLH